MKRALDEAAQWCARLQAPDCSSQQHRQFQQWLQAHPDNVEAYAMAEALCWGLHERVESDARLSAMVDRALAMGQESGSTLHDLAELRGKSAVSDRSNGDDPKKFYEKNNLGPFQGNPGAASAERPNLNSVRKLKAIEPSVEPALPGFGHRSVQEPDLNHENPEAVLKILANSYKYVASRKHSTSNRKSTFRFRLRVPLAAAASVMMVALLGGLKLSQLTSSEELKYSSSMSDQLTIKLQDGTQTQLDVNSAVNVKMTAESRTVELVRGRAIFDVATDQSRPFSVTVDGSQVIALGTRFQIQRDAHRMVVTLEEGLVDVIGTSSGIVQRQHLNPGDQLKIDLSASSPWEISRVEVDAVTSWSRGRHVFRSTPLAAALDEVNRYATTKIRLGEPNLREMEVSGNFLIGDSRIVASAFVAALPLRMVDIGTELILFPVHAAALPKDLGG